MAPGESLVVPRPQDDIQFRVRDAGFLEIITIVSQEPLRALLRNLQATSRGAGRSRGWVGFDEGNPLTMLDDLLGDVDGISRSRSTLVQETVSRQNTAVESGAIAAFSTILEIVQ
jgi:hypothetical protein